MIWELYRDAKLSEGVLPYTLKKYHGSLSIFESWLCEHNSIPSTETVQHFLSHLHNNGLSPFRIRNYWIALMSFYTWAETSGHITKNPMKGVRSPKLPKKTIDIYKTDEVRQVIDHTPRIDYQTIFTFYWRTGLRGSELLTTNPDDIDIDSLTIHIRGKGARERVVPFDNECLYLLTRNQDHPFDKTMSQVRRMLRKCCDECQVKYRGVHCFRHTFASNYLMAGGNPLDLMYILGHNSLTMVNHYSQWVASARAVISYRKIMA